jgi:hypothetical protein
MRKGHEIPLLSSEALQCSRTNISEFVVCFGLISRALDGGFRVLFRVCGWWRNYIEFLTPHWAATF